MINKYGEALHGLEAHSAHKEEAVSIRYEKVCRVMYVTLSSLKVFWINCTFKENYLKNTNSNQTYWNDNEIPIMSNDELWKS